jgi:hypothetical protein
MFGQILKTISFLSNEIARRKFGFPFRWNPFYTVERAG